MPQNPVKNILYIMTDQQRYDTLGCTGLSQCQTPNLDKLAAEGTRFDRAYSICPLCSPARASMLTGLYPHNHRMWNNNDMFQWSVRNLSDDIDLIAKPLLEADFNCGYTGKWHCGSDKVPSSYGFKGMDVPNYGNPYETAEYREYLLKHGLTRPSCNLIDENDGVLGGSWEGNPDACASAFLAQYAIDQMETFNKEYEETGKPFFQFISFWGPHAPYIVPEPYASMCNPAGIAPWPTWQDDLMNKPTVQRRLREHLGYPEKSWDEWAKSVAKYWGFVTFVDHQIGRILDRLSLLGRDKDTIIVFSADHGDMTGSRGGCFDKGPFPYQETYHIPLIVRAPGSGQAGDICNQLVSNMDLAATVLDAADIPVPGHYDARSLIPLVKNPDAKWDGDLMCEFHGHRFLFTQRILLWDNYKYVYCPCAEDELYDLKNDPLELQNLAYSPDCSSILQEGRKRMQGWLDKSHDPVCLLNDKSQFS